MPPQIPPTLQDAKLQSHSTDPPRTVRDDTWNPPSQLRFDLIRRAHSVFPFFGLRLANWCFRKCTSPRLLQRSFAGNILFLDVSRSQTHQLLFLQGEHLIHERDLLKGLLRPGMRVVDVGANIGYYTLLFHSVVGSAGEIICIEPSPENLVELRRNITANHFKNVVIHESPVGDRCGPVGLKSGINSGIVAAGTGTYAAELRRLDDVVREPVDFLKIDVDGFELQVLEGARQLLERDHPVLFLEFHPQLVGRHGGSFVAVRRLLKDYYSRVDYFDVPEQQGFVKKLVSRYSGCGMVRQFDAEGLCEEEMHIGRMFGTFWMVCRP